MFVFIESSTMGELNQSLTYFLQALTLRNLCNLDLAFSQKQLFLSLPCLPLESRHHFHKKQGFNKASLMIFENIMKSFKTEEYLKMIYICTKEYGFIVLVVY